MGKYIRKCRGGGAGTTAAPAVVVVAGVRTRSRSAAAAASVPAPKRPRKAAPTRDEVEVDKGRGDDGVTGGSCYLQLRSRKLFMVAAEVATGKPVPVLAEEEEASPAVPLAVTGSTASVEAADGVSRCSSTASSVDAAALRASNGCASEHACEDCGEESSISDSGCGRSGEWREVTPSSRAPGGLSDQESSKGADDPKHHQHRRSPATAMTKVACRARRMPAAEEIEEFFAAAEKAEAERFTAKYNFDVVRGVPLDAVGGRFEWTPVTSGG